MKTYRTSLVSHDLYNCEQQNHENSLPILNIFFRTVFNNASTIYKKIVHFILGDEGCPTQIVEAHGIKFITKKH
tara:strand:+ start:260 stop:481 length:222 start_codon:yes stop_codon:yes gene_type:complete